jgi:cytoskeletal protein CcmA (bactofilin family)
MSKSTSNTEHNVIVAGTIIKGDITTDGDFRIDGKIEGTIASKGRIIVGNSGNITGTVKAENIDVSDICTCCNSDTLHSHRATKGKRGNLAAIIELKDI